MKGRGFQILLICSLILNIFVLGGLGGAAIMWKRGEMHRPLVGMGQGARLRQAAQSLPQPHRRELRNTVVETMQSMRPQIQEARAARREAGRLLTAPTLDQAALEAAFVRARKADMIVRTQLESRMVRFVATLPEDERMALGEALRRPRDRKRQETVQ